MRPIAIVFLLALGLKAQIQELVSADDGSQLFFPHPSRSRGRPKRITRKSSSSPPEPTILSPKT
jgi:hypothetical protein